MIKIDVTSEKHGDNLTIKNTGTIAGDRGAVAQEMRAVLKEFHAVDGGETLIIAFSGMLEELANDKRNS